MPRLVARSVVVIAATVMLSANTMLAANTETDAATGLKMAENWELVRNNCIACHSLKLVTQQRGTAAQWLTVIRWMQDKQNLWQFEPETEARIINYLAENYPPRADQRRTAISPQLMPENPYDARRGSLD
jgi:hypothetical protein